MALRNTIAAKKIPSPTDKHVGARVRMRRKMLAMSQEQLADALGITYQQVQKNENGNNRIGASRLQQISHILQVPVEFFFESAPYASAPHGSESGANLAERLSGQIGLPLDLAHKRVMALAVSARPRPSAPSFWRPRAVMPLEA